MDAGERLCRLALAHIGSLRPREKLELVDMLGGAAPLFALSLADVTDLLGRRPRATAWDPAGALEQAAETDRRLTAGSMGSIFYWDAAYPPLLREIYDPPAVLFWRGVPPRHDLLTAAIVGTRLPAGAARKAAFRLGFELARAGSRSSRASPAASTARRTTGAWRGGDTRWPCWAAGSTS